jgi:hypothetical protein
MAFSPFQVGEIVSVFRHGQFIVRKVNFFKDPKTGTDRANLVVQRVFTLNKKVKVVTPNTPMEEVWI